MYQPLSRLPQPPWLSPTTVPHPYNRLRCYHLDATIPDDPPFYPCIARTYKMLRDHHQGTKIPNHPLFHPCGIPRSLPLREGGTLHTMLFSQVCIVDREYILPIIRLTPA